MYIMTNYLKSKRSPRLNLRAYPAPPRVSTCFETRKSPRDYLPATRLLDRRGTQDIGMAWVGQHGSLRASIRTVDRAWRGVVSDEGLRHILIGKAVEAERRRDYVCG